MIIHGHVNQTSVKIERSVFRQSSMMIFECETLTPWLLQMQAETLVYLSLVKALAPPPSRMGRYNCLNVFRCLLIRTLVIVDLW
jgi:hypothetical protein